MINTVARHIYVMIVTLKIKFKTFYEAAKNLNLQCFDIFFFWINNLDDIYKLMK